MLTGLQTIISNLVEILILNLIIIIITIIAKIQQATGPHEDPPTIIKRGKLLWYGHVSRSSGLSKTILQGTVKGGRRQGRQRKRREDNIRKLTGLEFAKSKRAVENRGNWFRNHLWCPNDPRRYGIDDNGATDDYLSLIHI